MSRHFSPSYALQREQDISMSNENINPDEVDEEAYQQYMANHPENTAKAEETVRERYRDKSRDHLNGQVEGLSSRMPTSQQWEMAARNAEAERQRELYGQMFNDQQAVDNDLNVMMAAVRQKQARQALNMQYANASLMKLAQNGGITPEAVNWWNTRSRSNDSDAQLQSAGYDNEGTFHMVFKDANGAEQDMKATPLMQYQMMNNMPGIFSDRDRIGMHDALLSRGHSDQELSKYSSQLNVVGGTTDGKATSRLFGNVGDRHSRISIFASDGKGGITRRFFDGFTGEDSGEINEGTRDPNSAGRWKQMSIGPAEDGKTQQRVYENTKTGERVTVKDGETPPWRKKETSGNWHENVARINADSREKVAGMNNETKKSTAQGHDESQERIQAMRERGRQARATMRDDQAWGKLAVEQEKVNKSFAVQMKKAKTYGQRVDLIEKKIKNDYEVAMKRAKTDEERQKTESKYKERMAGVAEGNLNLDWLKEDNDQTNAEVKQDQEQQKIEETQRHHEAEEGLTAERIKAIREKVGKSGVSSDRLKELNKRLDAASKVIANGSADAHRKAKADIDAIEAEINGNGGDKATIKSGDNTHNDKTPTGYRYNKDRTKRIPVYSDGSEGSVEDVQ